jgi:hypothetical protein
MTQVAVLDASIAAPTRMRRKLLRRLVWSVAAVVVGVGLFWTWRYCSALWRRDALIAAIRAKGEPVWWSEFAKKAVDEQSPETGAKLFMEALYEMGGELNPAKRPLAGASSDLQSCKFVSLVALPEVEAVLQRARPVFDLVEKANARQPGLLTTHLQTDDPVGIPLGHVHDTSNLRRLLWLDSFDALSKGDARRAYRAVESAFRLTDQMSADPLLISQVVRLGNLTAACTHLEVCLTYAAPTDQEARMLDCHLSKHDDGFKLDKTLIGDRAFLASLLEDRNLCRIYLFNSFPIHEHRWTNRLWLEAFLSPLGRPAMLEAQTQYLELYDRLRAMVDRPEFDESEFEEQYNWYVKRSPLHQLAGLDEDAIFGFSKRFPVHVILAHRRLIVTRLALRLRCYYDKHGKLPATLDDLCDADMPRIRLDWFKNHPITYRPSPSGFRLEYPEACVPLEQRHKLRETPLTEFGVEIEWKPLPKPAPSK